MPADAKEYPIKIALRIRPRNKKETETKQETIVKKLGDKKARLQVKTAGRVHDKTYAYDHVFGPETGQLDVYESVVAPCIAEVLEGYNCTVFAYGQTGTGKTHTMEGVRTDKVHTSYKDDRDSGLIPRALHHLFEVLESNPETEFSVRVSFLEIYNEDIFDLLGSDLDFQAQKKLAMYEDTARKGSVIIKGLEEVIVRDKSEVYGILQKGASRRSTAETKMNKQSSRSHSVFSCTVHQKENTVSGEELVKTGKMYLVDLAGAENIGRSGATNSRAREAGNINQSLLTLGRVISKLVEHAGHIPYRESKLTRLLQDSLGGRTKTSIIATVSPSTDSMEETMSTMDYALRAKSILNRPEANAKLTRKAVLTEFTKEIDQLKADLRAAREKNGVFLSTERHEEMTKQLESQKNEIEELMVTITARCEELEQVQTLFESTEAELKETAAVLAETRAELEQTAEAKAKAEELRAAAEAERDEAKFVLSETQATETTLHSQATGLVNVARTTTSHVDALHEKVQRTVAVTEINHRVASSAKDLIIGGIAQASDRAETFATTQCEALGAMRCDIASFVHKAGKQMAEMKERLNELQAASNVSMCTAFAGATASAAVTEGASEVCLSANETDASILVGAATDFATVQFPKSQKVLRSQIDEQAKLMDTFTQQVESQLLGMQRRMEDFAATTTAALTELKQTTTSHLLEQAAQFEAHEKQLAELVTARNVASGTAMKEVQKSIEDLLSNYFAEQSAGLVTDVEGVRSTCTTAATSARTYATQFQSTVDETTTNVGLFSNENQQAVNEHVGNARATSATSANQSNEALKTIVATHEAVVEQQHVMSDGISSFLTRNNAAVTSVRKLHSDYAAGVATTASVESATLCNAVDEIKATSDAVAAAMAYFGSSTAESIETTKTDVGVHKDESVTHLKEIATNVSNHIDAGLQVVVPTGATPMRQVYTYETKLAKTAPTDELLQRYHAQMRMETVDENDDDDADITDPATSQPATPAKSEQAATNDENENATATKASKLQAPTKSWSPFKRSASRKAKKPLAAVN
eukprot:m.195399 g.195399  ORF g.195399 m.195399 type:complete len:1050 (-) comp19472_c0_seq1:183-3332(-)